MIRLLIILSFMASTIFAREPGISFDFPDKLTTAYQFENIFSELVFEQPVALRNHPSNQSELYVVEKGGKIYCIKDINQPQKQLYLDISAQTFTNNESGLLSFAFHPKYDDNQTIFAFYNTVIGNKRYQRLSKFVVISVSGNLTEPFVFEERVLIQDLDTRPNHNGGDLHFGPDDDYLYVSLGDEGGSDDNQFNSQLIDKDFYSGILRIDVDRDSANIEPNPHEAVVLDDNGLAGYKVPIGNPFVGATEFNGISVDPLDVRTEFWAVGLRNPWRIHFDEDDQLWIADVGQKAQEEINIIPRGEGGLNFGWAYREGNVDGPKLLPSELNFTDPIYAYQIEEGTTTSIIGGVVYKGDSIEALDGTYIFADHYLGKVWSLDNSGANVELTELLIETNISAFGYHPLTDEILICDYDSGEIKQLIEGVSNESDIPQTLTETNLFTDLTTLEPASGVIAYQPNVNFWSDYAIKSRWFSLPDSEQKFGFQESGPWHYPTGTIWVKHFDLEMERGVPSTAERLETRVLVKTDDGVYGLSYQWNAAGTEATLVPSEGASIDKIIKIDGVDTQKTWTIPSRADCVKCHTSAGGYALSFNTRQLNNEDNIFGLQQNILTALYNDDYLDRDPGDVEQLERLVAANDSDASLENKVKSYFDMNCAYCHMSGGTTPAEFDLRYSLTVDEMNLINQTAIDYGDDPSRRLILPGDPNKSVLLSRISATHGFTRMPPIATTELDYTSISLVTEWINQLGRDEKSTFYPSSEDLFTIEAESFFEKHSGENGEEWIDEPAPYLSGGLGLKASPDIGTEINIDYSSSSPRLDYKLFFNQTGTYYVWVHGLGTKGSVESSDSVHVGLNQEEQITSEGIHGFTNKNAWSNTTSSNVIATLEIPSVGVHNINVWMDEDGFRFDRMILTPDQDFSPYETYTYQSSRSQALAAAQVEIDLYNKHDFFELRVSNLSDSLSIEKVTLTHSKNKEIFDVMLPNDQVTISPELPLPYDNSEDRSAEVLIEFNEPLAAGEFYSSGRGNDIDGNILHVRVKVEFSDGTIMTGKVEEDLDNDTGTRLWSVKMRTDPHIEY